MRARFVLEAYGSRDIARMKSMSQKSGGDVEKEIQYAKTMAKAITKAFKAQARAEAAAEHFGPEHPAVQIFHDRAVELGGAGVKSQPSVLPIDQEDFSVYDEPESQQTGFYRPDAGGGFKDPMKTMGVGIFQDKIKTPDRNPRYTSGWVMPIGMVNLQTGKNKMLGNVIDTWEDTDTVVEVWEPMSWRRTSNKHRVTFSSGLSAGVIGDKKTFYHDQNQYVIFEGKLVDYAIMKYMGGLIPKYGRTLAGYVYK